MIYIGLHGAHGAGKTTVARYLEACFHFAPIAFARPVKEAAGVLTSEPTAYYELRKHKDQLQPIFGRTRRELLNRLGDAVLQVLGSDALIKLADRRRRMYESQASFGLDYRGIVFTDVITEAEAQHVRQLGAQIWRITRPGVTNLGDHRTDRNLEGFCDLEICNAGEIGDLRRQVDEAMRKLEAVA